MVAIHQQKATFFFANNVEGINKFISNLHKKVQSMIVLEGTGSYEMLVLTSLTKSGFAGAPRQMLKR